MKKTRRKIAIVGSLGWLACLLAAPQLYAASPRVVHKINEGWKFTAGPRESAEWKDVKVPHTWNREDAFDDEPGYHRGVGWYRQDLRVDSDRRVFLYFEGVGQVAEVFINDKPVGKHIGGYTAFSFDITKFLRPGATNVLEVKADNTLVRDIPPIDGDFNMYGGIYRDVWLIETDTVHLGSTDVAGSGIAITTPQVSADTGSVTVSGSVVNSGEAPRSVQVTNEILERAATEQ